MTDRPRRLSTFARRGGRKLSDRQKQLVDTVLPGVAVPPGEAGMCHPADLFADPVREVWLEIGFGGGEHLLAQAGRHGDIGHIGCEPFIDGVAKVLTGIEEVGLTNLRLYHGDARDVMDQLAPGTIARVFILFPDPWPKTRHHKRRLIQPDFLSDLARILRPGGRVRFATDVRSYADEALVRFLAHGSFEWIAETADDWRLAPADHVTTRYETKQLGDIAPVWFDFECR